MKSLKEDIIEIYNKERGLLVFMVQILIIALGVFVFSLTKIDATSSVVKIGYGDIGGYRDGVWLNMFAFPILALVFGVLHNLLAVRLYKKRGVGMTKFFLATTLMLLIGTVLVLIRLSSEG